MLSHGTMSHDTTSHARCAFPLALQLNMLREVSRRAATRADAPSLPFPVIRPVRLREASTLVGEIPRKISSTSVAVVASVFATGLATGFALDLYGRSRASPEPFSGTPKSFPAPTGAAAVWRGTFDPGSNPRVTPKGAAPPKAFYDTVDDQGLSLWQQTLRAEDMRRTNFNELDRNGDGYLEREDLRRAFGAGVDVDALVAAADTDGIGRVSHKDWLVMKARLAEAYARDERRRKNK